MMIECDDGDDDQDNDGDDDEDDDTSDSKARTFIHTSSTGYTQSTECGLTLNYTSFCPA